MPVTRNERASNAYRRVRFCFATRHRGVRGTLASSYHVRHLLRTLRARYDCGPRARRAGVITTHHVYIGYRKELITTALVASTTLQSKTLTNRDASRRTHGF